MKPFMGNMCMHPHCQESDCKNCRYFTPMFYNIKVPKWLGHILFYIEWLMIKRQIKSKF